MARRPTGGTLLVALAAALAGLLVAGYAALGGGRYEPLVPPDACAATWEPGTPTNADETGQRVARLALARAACDLGATREDLTLALAGRAALDAFAEREGLPVAQIEAAVRSGVDTALAEASRQGALDADLAGVLGQAIAVLPLDRVVRTLDGTAEPCEELPWRRSTEPDAILAGVVVVAFQRTACALEADPLDVLDALVRPDGIARLATLAGIDEARAAETVQTALQEAVAIAADAGDLTPDVAAALDVLIEATPVAQALAILLGDASPCDPIAWRPDLSSLEQVAAQVALRAIASTACTLELPVASVATAIALPDGLAGVARDAGIDPAAAEAAARDGLRAGLAEAEANGAVGGVIARALEAAVDVVPVDRLLATLRGDEDPCAPLPWKEADGAERTAAQIVLLGLSSGACTLGTSTATLAEALAGEAALDAFAAGVPGGRDAVERALRDGLRGAIDQADEAGAVGGITSFVLGQVVERTPLLDLLDAVRGRVA